MRKTIKNKEQGTKETKFNENLKKYLTNYGDCMIWPIRDLLKFMPTSTKHYF